MEQFEPRVPVTILTGFLGSGKTTLLRRILADPQGARIGILVNDFGAVNVDAELVVEASASRMTLENGCVCCSIQGDLVGAISALLEGGTPPDRIVIEASGVSRPLPIAAALEAEELAGRTVLDGIFCLVDAVTWGDLDFEATELALDQAAGADLVILTKTDIAPPLRIATLETTLQAALPRLRLIRGTHGEMPRVVLFGPDAIRTGGRPALSHAATAEHHGDANIGDHHDHGAEFTAWFWRSRATFGPRRLRAALRELPPGLLRAKGIVRPEDGEGRIIVQIVGKRIEIMREEAEPPAESALVAIGRRGSFDPTELEAVMNACAEPSSVSS